MIFNSGKNPKWKYYLNASFRELIPSGLLRGKLDKLLLEIEKRPDADEIHQRASYYCKISGTDCNGWENIPLIHSAIRRTTIGEAKPTRQKVYYHDIMEYARYFAPELRLNFLPGDITYTPKIPAIVKSRPIAGENANSVLLNLDKVRHFIFPNDRLRFEDKKDNVLFRGKINGKPNRIAFMGQFFGKKGIDAGAIDVVPGHEDWHCEKLTLWQQLESKLIMALEGNDVASNLKWIMNSNSLAVTPRMRYETWFMEGTLRPGEHYVEVADDFSDLGEKAEYYLSHPAEAREIIQNANRYASKFKDKRREKLVSLLTLRNFLAAIN